MDMTQEKAYEIAYLGCVDQVIEYCDLKGITEIPIEELLKDDTVEELAEDFASILHLKKEEAIEFARFVFKDAAKTLAKRNTQHKNKDSADKTAFIDGVKLRGEPY